MKGLLSIIITILFISCQKKQEKVMTSENLAKGGLFIIGGGSRPSEMIDRLIDLSNLDEGYGFILPMASADDSAYYYANKQFSEKGLPD